MAAVKDHLWKKVLEVSRLSRRASDSSYFLWSSKDKTVSWRLPLKYGNSEDTSDIVTKFLRIRKDELIKDVAYRDDTLIFNLDHNNFISKTIFTPETPTSTYPKYPKSQNLVVEFSSPNIAKPFHVGHLRSTIVGQFVANILSLGNDVTRMNYLGDWGTQFGFVQKGLEMIQPTDLDWQRDPMGVLLESYTKSYNAPNTIGEARDIFAKLENEDSIYLKEWEKIKSITLDHLINIYKDLGVRFDKYSYESDYRASKIQEVICNMINNNVAHYENGQLVANINCKSIPLLRDNGTTLYITRDVAAALDRIQRFNCDKIVYVVDKSQASHFNNLAGVLEKLGHEGVLLFLPFGRISGMSTRKGTSVFLSDVVEESVMKMREQQKQSKNTRAADNDTTRILGLTGLKVYILKHGRTRDFVFDWTQALQGSGDSGVKVQYTHARLCSLEERFDFDPSIDLEFSTNAFNDPSVLPMVLEIARCDDIFRESAEKMESALVVSHLFKLCNLTSRALKNLQIKDQEPADAQSRLFLFHKARLKIKQTMEILGLTPLNKM